MAENFDEIFADFVRDLPALHPELPYQRSATISLTLVTAIVFDVATGETRERAITLGGTFSERNTKLISTALGGEKYFTVKKVENIKARVAFNVDDLLQLVREGRADVSLPDDRTP